MTTQLSREAEMFLRKLIDTLEDNGLYTKSRQLEALCDECGGAE